jgi:hypothetical protein
VSSPGQTACQVRDFGEPLSVVRWGKICHFPLYFGSETDLVAYFLSEVARISSMRQKRARGGARTSEKSRSWPVRDARRLVRDADPQKIGPVAYLSGRPLVKSGRWRLDCQDAGKIQRDGILGRVLGSAAGPHARIVDNKVSWSITRYLARRRGIPIVSGAIWVAYLASRPSRRTTIGGAQPSWPARSDLGRFRWRPGALSPFLGAPDCSSVDSDLSRTA